MAIISTLYFTWMIYGYTPIQHVQNWISFLTPYLKVIVKIKREIFGILSTKQMGALTRWGDHTIS